MSVSTLTENDTVTAVEGSYENFQGVIVEIDHENKTAMINWNVPTNNWDHYNQEWVTESVVEMFFPLDNLKEW